MTQSLMTLPLKEAGFVSEASGEAVSSVPQLGAGEASEVSFSETLRELLDSGVDPGALILVLQHAFVLPEGGVSLPASGSFLPAAPATGGTLLPPATGPVSVPGAVAAPLPAELETIDPEQLRSLLLGARSPGKGGDELSVLESGIPESLRRFEGKGLGDLAGDLKGVGMAHSISTPGSATALKTPLVPPLQVPVGQPGWEGGLGERIQWMLSRNLQQAEIKLTPPELGPLEIKISLHNDQGQVSFMAAHGATREALEAAIPRLREMFNEINLNLANVDVGQRQAGGSPGGETSVATDGLAGEDATASQGQETSPGVTRLLSHGLLDTYA